MTVGMTKEGAPPGIPVMRPQLPTADELLPYLRRIDASRYYSNHGALLREFEARLAAHFGVQPHQLAVVANGTVALSAALLAVRAAPGSRCLLPSWTFVGSAAAVWAANLRPHFVDVSAQTWMLEPEDLERRANLSDVGAVMVVSAFGAPVDIKAWDAFTERTGIPAIIDCAASFDTVATIPQARPGKSPIMISLHATKVLGTGEGGLVVSTDDSVMRRFHQVCNFGVWGDEGGQILGYNGKLSEYQAAVGLAMFDRWPERRALLAQLTEKYRAAIAGMPDVTTIPGYGQGWVSAYCNVRTAVDATRVVASLSEQGIETRRWWKSGIHEQSAYESFTRDPLPVTVRIARSVFGLPYFHDMRDEQLERVLRSLRDSLSTSRIAQSA